MTEGPQEDYESSADVMTSKDSHGGISARPVVAVTGSAGFVGSHVVDAFARYGWRVLGFDNMSSGVDLTPEGVERVSCDLAANLRAADLAGVDAVVHCAAYPELRHNWVGADGGRAERERLFRNNEIATRELLEKMPPLAPLVFISTSAVYGSQTIDDPPKTETFPPSIESPYAASKLACEAHVAAHSFKTGRRYYLLRICNQIGPRYHRGVVADFVRQVRERGGVHAADDGSQRKSWVDVRDTAKAISRLVRGVCLDMSNVTFAPSGVYNVAGAERLSWRDVVAVMRETESFDLTCEARAAGAVGDAVNVYLDSGKLGRWFVARRPVREAIRDALHDLEWGVGRRPLTAVNG